MILFGVATVLAVGILVYELIVQGRPALGKLRPAGERQDRLRESLRAGPASRPAVRAGAGDPDFDRRLREARAATIGVVRAYQEELGRVPSDPVRLRRLRRLRPHYPPSGGGMLRGWRGFLVGALLAGALLGGTALLYFLIFSR